MTESRAASDSGSCVLSRAGVRRLLVGIHDAAAGADAGVEQRLHQFVATDRDTPASRGRRTTGNSAERTPARTAHAARGCPRSASVYTVGQRDAPGRADPGSRRSCTPPDRRLDVGHPVVEARPPGIPRTRPSSPRAGRCRARSSRAGAAGGTCASSSGSRVVSMPPSPVVSIFRGWNEKQATVPCGLPIRSHWLVDADLAADRRTPRPRPPAGRAVRRPPGSPACRTAGRSGAPA